MTPNVSLSQRYGLKADNLNCPNGGTHEVDDGDLHRVAKEGGGTVLCLSCGAAVALRSVAE